MAYHVLWAKAVHIQTFTWKFLETIFIRFVQFPLLKQKEWSLGLNLICLQYRYTYINMCLSLILSLEIYFSLLFNHGTPQFYFLDHKLKRGTRTGQPLGISNPFFPGLKLPFLYWLSLYFSAHFPHRLINIFDFITLTKLI